MRPEDFVSSALQRNEEDIALLERMRNCDETALSDMYDKYAQICYSTVMHMLRSVEDAEEIIHDIFLEIWNKPDRYKNNHTSFLAQILEKIHKWAIAKKRERGFPKHIDLNDVHSTSLFTLSTSRALSKVPIVNENRNAVINVLQQLNLEEQQTLTLAYYGGYKLSEIAETTRLPIDIIKFRLIDAVATIKSSISEKI
jgi:RNA polymerase sigma-70 factor (ECF subfamily)